MTPAQALDSHRKFITEDGTEIIIRRYTGAGTPRPKAEAKALARVMGYAPHELVGPIVQGDRKIIVLNDPAATVVGGFVSLASLLPLTTNDKVVVRGKEMAVLSSDEDTRRLAGVLIAIELQARG
jgi:hypothetical protein